MTFDAHRMVQGPAVSFGSGPYHLTGGVSLPSRYHRCMTTNELRASVRCAAECECSPITSTQVADYLRRSLAGEFDRPRPTPPVSAQTFQDMLDLGMIDEEHARSLGFTRRR